MYNGGNNETPQFILRPVFAEIFRTCTHPQSILLRVEHVRRRGVTTGRPTLHDRGDLDGNKVRDVRLFLTDGQLLVQALLHQKILETPAARYVGSGDFIEVYKFAIKRAKRKNGDGSVVYLVIDDCHILTTHASPVDTSKSERLTSYGSLGELETYLGDEALLNVDHNVVEDDFEGGFLKEDGCFVNDLQPRPSKPLGILPPTEREPPGQLLQETSESLHHEADIRNYEKKVRWESAIQPVSRSSDTLRESERHKEQKLQSSQTSKLKRKDRGDSSEDDAPFETAMIDTNTAHQRRKALLDLDQHKRLPRPSMGNKSAIEPHDEDSDQSGADVQGVVEVHEGVVRGNTIITSKPTTSEHRILNEVRSTGPPTEDGTIAAPLMQVTHHEENKDKDIVLKTTTGPQIPVKPEPPFHSLAYLVDPPKGHSLPRKNYTLTTFAVVTHVGSSLISRPGSSFHPKRHIKIEDPSLHQGKYKYQPPQRGNYGNNSNSNSKTNGVTVAVYRDAADFKPAVGTVALFRGLVMQRLPSRDIILNVYAIPTAKSSLPASVRKSGSIGRAGNIAHDSTKKLTSNINEDDNDKRHRQGADPGAGAGAAINRGALPVAASTGTGPLPSQILTADDWFITSPSLLTQLGYDVEGMQSWWQSRQKGPHKSRF